MYLFCVYKQAHIYEYIYKYILICIYLYTRIFLRDNFEVKMFCLFDIRLKKLKVYKLQVRSIEHQQSEDFISDLSKRLVTFNPDVIGIKVNKKLLCSHKIPVRRLMPFEDKS